MGVFKMELLEGVKERGTNDWERGKFEFMKELNKYELAQTIFTIACPFIVF